MSLNRWKVAACTLTLGVGGLAVFAADKKETPPAPLPTLTVPAAAGDDTPSGPAKAPPLKIATPESAKTTPDIVIDIDLPELPKPVNNRNYSGNVVGISAPGNPMPYVDAPVNANGWLGKAKAFGAQAANAPVFVPVDLPPLPNEILPVKGEAEADVPKVPAPKPDPVKKDDKKPDVPLPPPVIDLNISLPEAPKVSVPPPPPPVVVPEVKKPTAPPAPSPFTDTPPKALAETLTVPPVPPVPPFAPLPPKAEPAPKPPELPQALPTAKLKMTLRMGDGKPRFEIRNTASEEILLKVSGEKVEMSAPPDGRPSTLAGVSAIGHVKFTAPGIEGSCDHLTILSGTGEVLMKGNIRLKTKRGKSWSEMTAEKMVYQIGATGLNAPNTPRSPVTPASYIPD